ARVARPHAALPVTVTSTVPGPAGVTALMTPSLSTVKLVAATPPNVTAVAAVKQLPLIVTVVPPVVGPVPGTTPVTVVAGRNRNGSGADAPAGCRTRTSAGPTSPAGVVTVIVVSSTTVKAVPSTPSKVTPVAPRNPTPSIVTAVPPDCGPLSGSRS